MTGPLDHIGLETEALKSRMSELDRLAEGLGARLAASFAAAAVQGRSLGDVLKGLALSLSRMAMAEALKPLGGLLGGLLGSLGGTVGAGRVLPFADGGIVNSPALFPLRGAAGLMGEAGPEAIMPLARGADGKLGVRAAGAPVQVTVNISTPDAASFQRSQAQVAAAIARAAARGQRNQ